uniref:Phosphoacetylglucosamine mutase n=1 Tax=Parastrongyloides trichosuri TaxID=131310 RepID=A0A0N4Z3N8_PARTI
MDDKKIPYGTAGFRGPSEVLEKIMIRVSVVATMLAREEKKVVGVMITASHNPINDNGVKIVDPNGEMINPKWEREAVDIVYMDDAKYDVLVEKLIKEGRENNYGCSGVIIGGDTRPSTINFKDNMISMIKKLNTDVRDLGIVTTPLLQYCVNEVNNHFNSKITADVPYHQTIKNIFEKCFQLMDKKDMKKYENNICLDAAYGVGNPKDKDNVLMSNGYLKIDLGNDKIPGILNHESGADYVKMNKTIPKCCQYEGAPKKCVSFDGDADRIVYFYQKVNEPFCLIDGDKIAAIYTKFIKTHLLISGLEDKLSVGVIQTAYANGASMKYFREKEGIEPRLVKTGVKYLHHEAKKYDIGIYFEANGHGTVLFSKKFDEEIKKNFDFNDSSKYLYYFSQLINRVTGDAVTDLLCVEICLRYFDWSIEDFYKIYEDLPNKQLKVPVSNRSLFETIEDETRLVKPKKLQDFIDDTLKKFNINRAFIRPSGTENIVRVFVEDSDLPKVDKVASILGEEITKQYSM